MREEETLTDLEKAAAAYREALAAQREAEARLRAADEEFCSAERAMRAVHDASGRCRAVVGLVAAGDTLDEALRKMHRHDWSRGGPCECGAPCPEEERGRA